MTLSYKQEDIDKEIRDIVNALNMGGLLTYGSCSGHNKERGFILLKDGRTLIILPSIDELYTWDKRELEFNEKIKVKDES